jgi:hypothetical protein
MSLAERTAIRGITGLDGDGFAEGVDGRRLVFPYGVLRRGYIISNAEREQALRDAVPRYRKIYRRVGVLLALLMGLCGSVASLIFMSSPFTALGVLFLPGLFGAFCAYTLLHCFILRPLLLDLTRVHLKDERIVRERRILAYVRIASALYVAAASVLTLVIIYLYHRRISALPTVPGAINYYADITIPLVLSFTLGIFWLGSVLAWKKLVARRGFGLALLCVLGFGIIELVLIQTTVQHYFHPTLKIVVTRDGLTCGQYIRWSSVSGIALDAGFRQFGTTYAKLELGPKPPASEQSLSPKPFSAVRCEITGLNVDHDTVYRSMLTAWRGAD